MNLVDQLRALMKKIDASPGLYFGKVFCDNCGNSYTGPRFTTGDLKEFVTVNTDDIKKLTETHKKLIELLERAKELNEKYVSRFDTMDLSMKPPNALNSSVRLAQEASEWLHKLNGEGEK